MVEIIIAIVTGIFSITGVVITSVASNRKLQQQLEVNQAVTNTKIENLTEEVRQHNGFATKIPVLEQRINTLEETNKELRNLISALEREIQKP